MTDEAKAVKKDKPEYKYGVSDVTEAIGTKSDSDTRRILRNADVAKADGRYGWNNKSDLEAAIKACKEKMRQPKAEKPAKAEKAESAAPKATVAKAKVKKPAA